jgi:hypothetical protein
LGPLDKAVFYTKNYCVTRQQSESAFLYDSKILLVKMNKNPSEFFRNEIKLAQYTVYAFAMQGGNLVYMKVPFSKMPV